MALVAYGSNGASEHSLQAATTLRNFVLKVDCESGRIIYASPSIKAALSLDDDALCGCSIETMLHPDDVEDFMLYCRCPSDFISCLPQITKGSITAADPSSSSRANGNCHYVTFLCRMVNGHCAPKEQPQYTVVRVSGKQQDTDEESQKMLHGGAMRIEDCRPLNGTAAKHQEDRQKYHGAYPENLGIGEWKEEKGVQQMFFSLVEVPTVSLKLELTPNPEHFSVHEYMLSSDQSPIILFADPRIERILGFTQVEVVGRTGYDFVMPKDQLFIVAAQFDAVLKCREPVPVAARLKTKSGKIIFTRSRVYLNLDHWTKKIKNYVTISTVISKRTAFKLFQRQIRTVASLRKNKDNWNDMLNLLELTEEQKLFVSKMDLKSYLDDFSDCLEEQKNSLKQIQMETKTNNISGATSSSTLCRTESCSGSSLNGDEGGVTICEIYDADILPVKEIIDMGPEFNPVPFIEEVIKFFPRDFPTVYKVSRVSRYATLSNNVSSPPSQSQQLLEPAILSPSDRQCPTQASSSAMDASVAYLGDNLGAGAGINAACNLVDSSCKFSLDSGVDDTSASVFTQPSLVRSLLQELKNDMKPSGDFQSLISTAACSDSSGSGTVVRKRAAHLKAVRIGAAGESRASMTGVKGPKYSKGSQKKNTSSLTQSQARRISKSNGVAQTHSSQVATSAHS